MIWYVLVELYIITVKTIRPFKGKFSNLPLSNENYEPDYFDYFVDKNILNKK